MAADRQLVISHTGARSQPAVRRTAVPEYGTRATSVDHVVYRGAQLPTGGPFRRPGGIRGVRTLSAGRGRRSRNGDRCASKNTRNVPGGVRYPGRPLVIRTGPSTTLPFACSQLISRVKSTQARALAGQGLGDGTVGPAGLFGADDWSCDLVGCVVLGVRPIGGAGIRIRRVAVVVAVV